MGKSIPYKKKLIYTVTLFLLMMFGLYQKNFSKIKKLNDELEIVETRNTNSLANESNLQSLSDQIKVIEEFIGDSEAKPDFIQREIIDFISSSTLDHSIIKIYPIHSIPNGEFLVNSFTVTIEGDFNNLLKLLKSVEDELLVTKVVSVKFYSNQNYKLGRKELFLDIIFQNYEKI